MAVRELKDSWVEKRTFAARAVVAGIICLLLTGVLSARLVNLQILKQSYYATRSDENRMRLEPIAPVRGLIYDRNGILLAQNAASFVLEVIPERVQDMDEMLGRLSQLIQLDPSEISRFKDRVRRSPRYRGVPLRTNLSMEEVARFEVDRHLFAGVSVTAGLSRAYPLGSSASHVIGYVGGINEAELKRINPDDYEGLSQIGKIGVERSHEDQLRGQPGSRMIEANAHGRPLRELDSRPGTPGRNLILTLDAKVQMAAEKALGEFNGAVVAIDPRNGEVLAMVSKPGFDPHEFVEGISQKSYRALLEDPHRPLYNRALQGQYPPGSTIKPFMALAALSYNLVDHTHTEYCSGSMSLPGSSRRYRCWRRIGHGTQDMDSAIVHSCDIYFYQLSILLGIDRIHSFLDNFGLGHRTDIDLPLEKTGLLPSSTWKRRALNQPWYPGETLSVGIGQGYMNVTPLQLAQITARLADRGKGFVPHVVKAYQDPISGQTEAVQPMPLPPIEDSRPKEWDAVVQAMVHVTSVPGGTGYRAFLGTPYAAAGKSGSAQVASLSQEDTRAPSQEDTAYHLRDHALFVAFAPAEEPSIAVAVIAEHGAHGGSVAGPVARQVIDQALLGHSEALDSADPEQTTPDTSNGPETEGD